VNGGVAGSAWRRVEFASANGARGVRAEPGVDARHMERVAADGEQAYGVAGGELGQADRALGRRRGDHRLLLEPRRGECGQDRGVQPGHLPRRLRLLLRVVRRRIVGVAVAAPSAAQPEGEEVEEVAQEEDGEEAEEEHEEDEHREQLRERRPLLLLLRCGARLRGGRSGGDVIAVVVVMAGVEEEEAARGACGHHVHRRTGRNDLFRPFRRVWLMARGEGRSLVGPSDVVWVLGGCSRGLYGEVKATPGRHDTDMHRACMGKM
jgi:hypothetical protein